MFNVATGPVDCPHAVLIRGVEPLDGVKHMLRRRQMTSVRRNLTAGPGLVCQALGINKMMSGTPLYDKRNVITIHDHGHIITDNDIIASPRVGMRTAEEWTETPWRFRISNNPWTSPAK
jgi:DNA-3-methyladenine glycosylase